ncbi:hypothetical protein H7U19_16550 [Hyunsoonleella sp. SJ7]|uniref:Lipoprotein n=1 Tax=Hyunsoonleella aquatilis TaxID=2762758 RepID=A0A923HCE9_9FLAO|nr:hypothetical protein [Hyunsoonleella aquatilis]MBC3760024.1 hypothetical protein [Hyunsoonleella aquatilis]
MKNLLILLCLLILSSCKEGNKVPKKNDKEIFNFVLSDTIAIGRNLARINEYSRVLNNNQEPFISVIVKNENEDGTKIIDTFSDGLRNPFFGISRYSVGNHKIEFTIEEKIATKTEIDNDSMELSIQDIYHHFDFNVYVKGNGYESPLNEILRKKMDEEYEE